METIVASEDRDEEEANDSTPAPVPVRELNIADRSYCVDTAFSSVGGPDFNPIAAMNMDEGSARSLLTPLLSQWQSPPRNFRHSQSCSPRVLLTCVSLACIMLAVFCVHLTHRPARTKPPATDNRLSAFQACASQLSPRIQCPDSPKCKDVQGFFMKQAELIEIKEDACSWNSDFGLLLSLILIRDSLALGDPSWHPVSPLERAKDVCRWKRIKCDAHGVVELGLSHDALLTGTLPTELGGLIDLQKLVLFSNQNLGGTIPSQIGMLSKMTSIQLHQSSISGEIPSEIASLKNLTELLLDGTELSGTMPADICAMTKTGLLQPPHVSCYSVACTCCKCRNGI